MFCAHARWGLGALLLLSSLLGCQERFNARVAELDAPDGADYDFDYGDDGLLEELEIGPIDIGFIWANGNIVGFSQGYTFTTVDWESGRVVRLLQVDETATRETLYRYTGSLLTRITRQRHDDDGVSGVSLTTLIYDETRVVQVTFAYDNDNDGTFEDPIETHTYSYDEDQRLSLVERDTQGVAGRSTTVTYTDEGQVRRINSGDFARSTNFSYDESGRMQQIRQGAEPTYDVVYENGAAPAIIVDPLPVMFAPFFDWRGTSFGAPDPRSLSLILDLANASSTF